MISLCFRMRYRWKSNEAIAGYAYKHEVDVVLNPIPAKKLSKELMECVTYLIVNEQADKINDRY